MNYDFSDYSSPELIDHLQEISTTIDEEDANDFLGRRCSVCSKDKAEIPAEIKKFITVTRELEQGLQTLYARRKDEREELPEKSQQLFVQLEVQVVKKMKVMDQLVDKVPYEKFLELITPKEKLAKGSSALLKSAEEGYTIDPMKKEWHLNFGLLMNVYNQTKDKELKNTVSFLIINYLAKAAPINIADLNLDEDLKEKFKEMFQISFFDESGYHRESSFYDKYAVEELAKVFAKKSGRQFILTDTTEFDQVLPLNFNLITPAKEARADANLANWTNIIEKALENHLKKHPDDREFSEAIDPPVLFDLTQFLKETIKTNGESRSEEQFNQQRKELQEVIIKALEAAVKRIQEKSGDTFSHAGDFEKLRMLLLCNLGAICRTEVNGVAVLKILPIFDEEHYVSSLDPDGNKQHGIRFNGTLGMWKGKLTSFVSHSGFRIGAIQARSKIFNLIGIENFLKIHSAYYKKSTKPVTYAGSERNPIIYPKKTTFVEQPVFKRFKDKCKSEELREKYPEIVIGAAFCAHLEGLLGEISEERWTQFCKDPEKRLLLQTSMHRMELHLKQADATIADFNKFSEYIELAQAELTTLLTLFQPFEKGSFEKIYKERVLPNIPEELQEGRVVIQTGVGRSAMSVLAAINVAEQATSSNKRVYGNQSYFENIPLMGEKNRMDQVKAEVRQETISLYATDFNHNIDTRRETHHYEPEDVIGAVKQILEKNPADARLTVAIDCTIDYIQSKKAKDLLKAYVKQIKDGKLNFIFYRSGQKFDMLGLDSYYGAPYYMVNNGSTYWEHYQKTLSQSSFQTDPLSLQWFCLSNKYGGEYLDVYRKIIFENNREILKEIPSILLRENKPIAISVSTAAPGMDTSFIDIKVLAKKSGAIVNEIEKLYYEMFGKAGKKAHSRGSFGFYHPNLNIIPGEGVRNVRVNLGISKKDVTTVKLFLKRLAEIEEREQQKAAAVVIDVK